MGGRRDNGYIVLNNDQDFGVILTITRAAAPSTVPVRTPDCLIGLVMRRLRQHQSALERGALISIDEERRARGFFHSATE